MVRTLSLDLGTACGWAYADRLKAATALTPADVAFGTFDLRLGKGGEGVRYLKFRQELDRFADKTDEVVFELVRRHCGTQAAHVYGGLKGVLTGWCEEHGVAYSSRSVQEIKIYSAGKGNAGKEDVIKAVMGWGFSPTNDNEADAIALLRLRLSETDRSGAAPVPVPRTRRNVARGTHRADAVRPAAGGEDGPDDPRLR